MNCCRSSCGWVFVSFAGITGFGVPVAVGAPILLGLGVNPFMPLSSSWDMPGQNIQYLAVARDALVLQTNTGHARAVAADGTVRPISLSGFTTLFDHPHLVLR